MKKGLIAVVVIIIILVIVGFALAGSYNGLVAAQESLQKTSSDIDTQLQRRNHLIPNLVNTVKGYAAHEEDVFTAVSDARSRMAGAESIEEKSAANAEVESALSRLLVVAEAYPQLQANQNFINQQDELAGTENRIQVARTRYNEEAQSYNQKVRSFPTCILASMFGLETATDFEAPEGAREGPTVDFS